MTPSDEHGDPTGQQDEVGTIERANGAASAISTERIAMAWLVGAVVLCFGIASLVSEPDDRSTAEWVVGGGVAILLIAAVLTGIRRLRSRD